MFKKIVLIATLSLTYFVISACTGEDRTKTSSSHKQKDIITTTIIGSTKSPDPILTTVRKLEQQGILTNLAVMESFPAQIKITGPRNVISKLEAMPR